MRPECWGGFWCGGLVWWKGGWVEAHRTAPSRLSGIDRTLDRRQEAPQPQPHPPDQPKPPTHPPTHPHLHTHLADEAVEGRMRGGAGAAVHGACPFLAFKGPII